MSQPIRLIVNVDDCGLHPAVQRAVEQGQVAGVLNSTSVLANGPCAREAASLSGLAIGAHLNLLRGRPLSPPDEIPTLIGSDSRFPGQYRTLAWRLLAGQVNPDEVRLEWTRQIEALLGMGVTLTHLDSEKHLHAWPRLWGIACDLARQFNLGWLRRPLDPTPLWPLSTGLNPWLLRRLCARHRLDQAPPHPDRLWGTGFTGPRLNAAALARMLDRTPPGSLVEVCVHPGLPRPGDPPVPADFGPLKVRDWWQIEFDCLTGAAWRGVLAREDVRLWCGGEEPLAGKEGSP